MPSSIPLLTVIITCFNYEKYVGRAIDSVLRQNDDRCRVVVVDDGSTDRSWSVITGYDVARLQVPNGGAVQAACHALTQAQTPFVLFLDADDELAPGSLATIIPRLDADVAKLQFALIPIDASGTPLGKALPRLAAYRSRSPLQRDVLETGSYLSPPTSGNVFRRDLCDLLAEVDYEMSVDGITLFAAPFFGDVVSLAEPLGFYRLHGRNYSQTGSWPTAQRFHLEAERFVARLDHLRRVLSRHGTHDRLPDPRRLFFYRERRLYEAIANGERVSTSELIALQALARRSISDPARRAALLVFLGLCWLMPRRLRQFALAYRFRTGRRSPFALIRLAATRSGLFRHPQRA